MMGQLDPRLREEYGAAIRGLDAADKKAWWDAYLKGAVEFRGIPLPTLRSAVVPWFSRRTAGWGDAERVAAATAFLSEPFAEDKLTGVLLLELLESAIGEHELNGVAEQFRAGHVSDWGTTDWLAIKALSRVAARDRELARHLVEWVQHDGETCWLRRAGLVAFVPAAEGRRPAAIDLVSVVLPAAATLAADDWRFSQTAVGWFLRELSRTQPEAIIRFVEDRSTPLSREARSMALARIEGRTGGARRRSTKHGVGA